MKKLFFFSAVFFGIGFKSYSQNLRIGVSAGTSFANYQAKADGESDKGDSKIGFAGGVLLDIPAGNHFSFQPALNFIIKGTKDEQTFGDITEKNSLTTNHLEIPLNLLYNTNGDAGSFFIGAGPSVSFGLSGKWKYDDGTDSFSEDVQFGDTEDDEMKSVDLGANILTGYCFPNGLFISANYNLGLSNLIPGSSDVTLKNSYFGIRIGFLFNGNSK